MEEIQVVGLSFVIVINVDKKGPHPMIVVYMSDPSLAPPNFSLLEFSFVQDLLKLSRVG